MRSGGGRRSHGAALPIALGLLVHAAGCVPDAPRPRGPDTPPGFSFAVVGDVPYSEEMERLFPALSAGIGAADVAFVIHIGDVKGSWSACTDSLLAARVDALDAFGHPLVFVPGDNDWTDCHRSREAPFRPLERLDFLRTRLYPEPGRTRGPTPMRVESQAAELPEFPEHQRWVRADVWFATVHMVGSANGLAPFAARTAEDDAEVGRRVAAAVAWIEGTFARARAGGAPAVVIATQADPWFEGERGFEEVMATLAREADAFDGQVLFIHGDSHAFRVDRPFWSESNPVMGNFTRLGTYGAPDVGWVRVDVDPGSAAVFAFAPHPVRAP